MKCKIRITEDGDKVVCSTVSTQLHALRRWIVWRSAKTYQSTVRLSKAASPYLFIIGKSTSSRNQVQFTVFTWTLLSPATVGVMLRKVCCLIGIDEEADLGSCHVSLLIYILTCCALYRRVLACTSSYASKLIWMEAHTLTPSGSKVS